MRKKRQPPIYWVKAATFFLIKDSNKDLLVRSENWFSSTCSIGQVVEIRATVKRKVLVCRRRVVARRCYNTMLEIVEHEDLGRLAHGNKVQALSYLARIYRPDQEEAPAVVLELALVDAERH